jgi:hypothetical protein
MAQEVSHRPLTAETRVRSRGQFMWDLWSKKWHWDRFFPEYFSFPPSTSFHQCSIIRKNEKKIIFITGLHDKPQGCGASVASAAGPLEKRYHKCMYILLWAMHGSIVCSSYYVRLEAVTAVVQQSGAFWCVTLCNLVKFYQAYCSKLLWQWVSVCKLVHINCRVVLKCVYCSIVIECVIKCVYFYLLLFIIIIIIYCNWVFTRWQ